MKNEKIIFAHVPKTAGTSFRTGLEQSQAQYYHLYKDYGSESPDTSKEILETNNEKLISIFLERSKCIISGHFQDSKLKLFDYAKLIKGAKLVTFLRDPLDRAVSEYWHFKERTNYKGTFLEMISQDLFTNRQLLSINYVPLETFSYVGITENYENCLTTFNQIFEMEVPFQKINERLSSQNRFLGISKSDIDLFCTRNLKDISLYNRALTYSKLLNRESPKITPYKQFSGFAKIEKSGEHVLGWAVDYFSFDPVNIVFQNKDSNKNYTTKASIKRNFLIELNLHASGYAGFKTEIKTLRDLLGKGKIDILINGKFRIGSITC